MAKATLKSTKTANSNSNSGVLKLVEKCILSAKTAVQSVTELENVITNTALATFKHAHDHGDVMPAHRLVIGLRGLNHPATTRLSLELVTWFRLFSPVYWDAKMQPHQRKEGEDGWKEYDEEGAEGTPFNQTDMALNARKAMDDAHAAKLKEVTLQSAVNRARGVLKFISGAKKADKNGQVRGIKTEDEAAINDFSQKLDAFLSGFTKKEVAA